MTNDIAIDQINQRMEAVFAEIPKKYQRFFHRRSLNNFMYYLPRIKGRTEQQEIAAAITAYLDEFEIVFPLELNIAVAADLFNRHLYPVARKFEWRCGFVPIVPLRACWVLFPQLAAVFCLVFLLTIPASTFYCLPL
ncbi:hypothetical protein [Filimonas effusa]|uniref:Uncharacterized protein n=1 Tax=Filimonas effusa TaxID=2508721 RepID=A0A4Q1DCU1_9BACT|nr:hypothetical protein [Filimonas effusa]RXK86453.1 hypothetical protein ESB13_06500 [Filimonas effusa]